MCMKINAMNNYLVKCLVFGFVFLFFTLQVFAQKPKNKKIEYTSKTLYVNEVLGPKVKVLKEDVTFFHDGATMYCDSAYYNDSENFFDAFGNIQLIKPTEKDTVYLYGDTLHYSGKDKMAKVRNNVRLVKDSLVMTTNNLNYDLSKNIGNYFDGGRTINHRDTITSRLGYYYSDDNMLFFKDSVVVKNPKFILYSDTLKHHTKTEISTLLGPTRIISDSNYIYSERGWYNHDKNVARFYKNSLLKSKEHTLTGDSLYYDRNNGIGMGFRNVVMTDTLQKMILTGNYGIFNEKTERSLMTDKALFIQITEKDSLYMHADTLRAFNDSVKIDSLYRKFRVVQAYNKVKIYKTDFQAKCDSLIYSFKDSVMFFYTKPVIWSEENQLTAKLIRVATKKNEVEKVYMDENAFIISKSDSVRYNQIIGKNMTGFVKDRALYKVEVREDGKVTYFIKDDAKSLIGVNKIECKDMNIFLENKKIDKIWFYTKPKATMYPPLTLPDEDLKYPGFVWYSANRPNSKKDVFIWNKDEEINTSLPEKKDKKEKKNKNNIKNKSDKINNDINQNKNNSNIKDRKDKNLDNK